MVAYLNILLIFLCLFPNVLSVSPKKYVYRGLNLKQITSPETVLNITMPEHMQLDPAINSDRVSYWSKNTILFIDHPFIIVVFHKTSYKLIRYLHWFDVCIGCDYKKKKPVMVLNEAAFYTFKKFTLINAIYREDKENFITDNVVYEHVRSNEEYELYVNDTELANKIRTMHLYSLDDDDHVLFPNKIDMNKTLDDVDWNKVLFFKTNHLTYSKLGNWNEYIWDHYYPW